MQEENERKCVLKSDRAIYFSKTRCFAIISSQLASQIQICTCNVCKQWYLSNTLPINRSDCVACSGCWLINDRAEKLVERAIVAQSEALRKITYRNNGNLRKTSLKTACLQIDEVEMLQWRSRKAIISLSTYLRKLSLLCQHSLEKKKKFINLE